MFNAKNFPMAANEGRMQPSVAGRPEGQSPASHTPIAVPIRSIGPSQRPRIAEHLLGLDATDRYLRFGYAASDEQILRYVENLDFDRDDIFGIFNRKLELIAMAHLALASDAQLQSCAEFGVSVAASTRGRGFGTRLFERAVMHARNDGIQLLFIQALSENAAMLKIARKAGARVENHGSESEAFLRLAAPDFDSRMTEFVHDRIGETDYRLKEQAKRFHDLMEGVRQARHRERESRRG